MKFIQQTCKAALAAFAIGSAPAAPFAFNDGDLILGVQAYGGTGASQNVFFNLGSGVALRDNGNKGQIGNIGATLSKVFGANWYSRADVYYGVIGNLSNASPSGIFGQPPVKGDPARTFYLAQAAVAPGKAPLIPANSYVSSALGSAATKFGGMESMIVGTPTTPGLNTGADGAAVLDQTAQPVEWNNSWSIWNPSLGLGVGPAFDTFTGGIQQNFGKGGTATYVDIQRVLATNDKANPTGVEGGGTYETSIAITSAGAVFAQTSAIVSAPEVDVQQPAGKSLVDGTASSDFGKVGVGKTSEARSFVITNKGSAPLTGLAITVAGNHPADFTVSSLTATSLAAGVSTTVSVTFKPSSIGSRSAVLRIASNDSDENPFDISLAGTGIASLPEIDLFQATNALIDGKSKTSFGAVKIGKPGLAKSFTIRNTGGANLTGLRVSINGVHSKEFILTQPRNTIVSPGATTSFTVRFKPSAKGSRTAALHVTSNDANETPYDIGLTGIGLASPQEIDVLQPSGSPLKDGKSKKSFGTVKITQTGKAKTFTIRNTGGANLTKIAITKSGAHAKDFIITQPRKLVLPSGASTTFTVKFKPSAKGTRNAVILIRSNDANENPFDIPVAGMGAR